MKEELLELLKYSPIKAFTNPNLSGWMFLPSGEFICAVCAGRLIARGCFDNKAIPVWKVTDESPECLLAEAHHEETDC
jgi:hypothetical protein